MMTRFNAITTGRLRAPRRRASVPADRVLPVALPAAAGRAAAGRAAGREPAPPPGPLRAWVRPGGATRGRRSAAGDPSSSPGIAAN
jgi:hypothetical protein